MRTGRHGLFLSFDLFLCVKEERPIGCFSDVSSESMLIVRVRAFSPGLVY